MPRKIAVQTTGSDNALTDLKRLGFTEYEARTYLQLLRQNPATAYELSKSTGVPRPNTYNALEALSKRGAALPISEAPVKYVPADPQVMLEAISRQTMNLCEDLSARLLPLKPTEDDDQYVWTLRGEEAIRDKIDRLIEGSRQSLFIKGSDHLLRPHKPALKSAAERGMDILIVLFGTNIEEFVFSERCRVYRHEASGVRMGTTDNLFTIAADQSEMLTATLEDEVVAAHTRNRTLVNVAASLVRHDYYMAEIFSRFGKQIDQAFGKHLRDLRLACFTPEQAASFKLKTGQ
jgi:sugar-specific transcriptional regulator TrmB